MLSKTLFACASLVVAAVAQTTSRIAFTVLPTNVTAGKPTTLQWGGGDGSAVTITLQQGPSTNLKAVSIVTGDATGFSYTWTPSASLPDADNYALKISQGDNEPNYTGMITLTGGSAAVSSGASASATSSASSSVTTSPSSGGAVPIGGLGSGSSGSSSANVTTTQIVHANATATQIVGTGGAVGTGAVGTGAGASGSAAAGTALHRNTTMSKATLTSTGSSSTSSAAATTTDSGSTTSSGPAPSSSSKSGAVMVAASNFALLCAAVVGVVYLG